jgi:hypothetical protein
MAKITGYARDLDKIKVPKEVVKSAKLINNNLARQILVFNSSKVKTRPETLAELVVVYNIVIVFKGKPVLLDTKTQEFDAAFSILLEMGGSTVNGACFEDRFKFFSRLDFGNADCSNLSFAMVEFLLSFIILAKPKAGIFPFFISAFSEEGVPVEELTYLYKIINSVVKKATSRERIILKNVVKFRDVGI